MDITKMYEAHVHYYYYYYYSNDTVWDILSDKSKSI